MKWCRELLLRACVLLSAAGLLATGVLARGELADWLQNLEGHGRFEMIFFRVIMLPSGPLTVRRLPAESRRTLDDLAAKAPRDYELYLMRAHADEELLDFAAAEADWQKYSQLAPDRSAAQLQVADFYHRRLRPADEIRALNDVAREPASAAEKLLPSSRQKAWQAFERSFQVIRLQALPDAVSVDEYNAWIAHYPHEAIVYSRYFNFLLESRKLSDAAQLIGRYEKVFPEDKVFPIEARATLAYKRGSTDEALALYDRSFQPLWPPRLIQDYFSLLKQTHRLREFLSEARAGVAAHPDDVNAAARLFYYYQQQGNAGEAQRALVEYRRRRERLNAAWTGDQLWTLARLFDAIHMNDDAARACYALYSLPDATPDFQERALFAITNLLLSAPDQPISFGNNSISFLRDIGEMDRYPGFLNGIVSLLLNSQSPADQYAQTAGSAVAYFHRARAADLVALLDERFPKSVARSGLHARLIDAYAVYGVDDAVLREGQQFLADFPRAPQRIHVALLMADSYARQNRVPEELALYNQTLNELAGRADHVPLGEGSRMNSALNQPSTPDYEPSEQPTPEADENPGAGGEGQSSGVSAQSGVPIPQVASAAAREGQPRSPEYSQVLERYISRLVALHRPLDVLEVFRRELDHNPNDPGLYERLVQFLDQNHMDERIEAVYQNAIQQFPDRSWYQKLARWYLSRKRQQQFENLTQQVIRIFSGSELQAYFQSMVWNGPVVPQMYVLLNVYAHERFPNNLTFVRNLLAAYRSKQTYNSQAWTALIRQYWFYDEELRSAYFVYLASSGRLNSELQAVRGSYPSAGAGNWHELSQMNPEAAQFIAEAEAWRSHFESAAPVIRGLAEVFPADQDLGTRAASLYRSLAGFHPEDTEIAVGLEKTSAQSRPADRDILIRIGDTYADRDLFAQARPYWNRAPQLQPGNSDAYLQPATVFWDYFLYGDTLRIIRDARRKFSDPALFAYDAGAVYENEQNYPRAVDEYLKGALADGEDSRVGRRLLQLVKRPTLQAAIDQATASAAAGNAPSANAVALRIAVLKALARRADLQAFLTRLAQNTSSLDLIGQILPVAEEQGLNELRVAILERQIALLADPVEKLQTRLEIARFYEGKNQIEQARAVFQSVYAENPLLLGVVRSTVDFYWRNKLFDPAIDVLLQAAKFAYPDLSRNFTFEAARKATEAREYARARELLNPLLKNQPYNAEFLAAMADSLAQEGNDASLRDFYIAQIAAFRSADLPADEKAARIAALRRGLVPALARLKDFAGALDQYIEIINSFPEDEALTQEVAAFAGHHSQRQRLLDFYTRALADSPKNFRWPMVLARIQTYFEDYDAAIASYARACAVRPDRADLLTAQAGLEERLMRFDAAMQSYTRLYELTYQNPQWMEKIAEINAREGRNNDAVSAVKRAFIEGRPEAPGPYFQAAGVLAGWSLLDPARQLAARAVELAGNNLLIDANNVQGALTYVTVLTRLRDYRTAYATLMQARNAAQQQKAQPSLNQFFSAMGAVVKQYYTPEETGAFSQFLVKQKEGMDARDFVEVLIPFAQFAGLEELEARWRFEIMMANPGSAQAQNMNARLGVLQTERMRFNECAGQLEDYWKVFPQGPGKDYLLEEAAENYRAAGNTSAELNALQQAFERQDLGSPYLQRYLELLAIMSPQRLVELSGTGANRQARDAAAGAAVASGKGTLALDAIGARGQGLPTVWTSAYTALVGLYYADGSAGVNGAFLQALDRRSIAERIAAPVNRDSVLAGNIWFYYGSRYGEYLAATHQGGPEDYLPAMVEGEPVHSEGYFRLADYYRDAGQLDAALKDYAHSLELSSNRGDAHDRMAQILWQQGKEDAATQEWSLALQAFYAQERAGAAPPAFWTDVHTTLEHIGQHKLLPPLRTDADRLLRTYIAHNGTYMVDSLLDGAMSAAADPEEGCQWLIDLSSATEGRIEFLSNLLSFPWFPDAQKALVYQKIIELAQDRASKTFGAEHTGAVDSLNDWQRRWALYLLAQRRTAEAQGALNKLPEKYRDLRRPDGAYLMILLAAESHKIDALVQELRQNPDLAPSLDDLRNDSVALRKLDPAGARMLLEYIYTRKIDEHRFTAADFLGLAEIRMQEGNFAAAVSLLERMNRVAGEPFENLTAAGDLMVAKGHPADATRFYQMRVQALPWDADARLKLAQAEIAANLPGNDAAALLAAVGSSPTAAYATRAAAAETIAHVKLQALQLGSAELNLLASNGPWAEAEAPNFYYARIQAARGNPDAAARVRLLVDAVAIHSDNSGLKITESSNKARPEVLSPRILLFQAAIQANQDQLAFSTLRPLVNSDILLISPAVPGNEAVLETIEQRQRIHVRGAFLAGQDLDQSQQWTIAVQMAGICQKLGRLEEASQMWKLGALLAPDDVDRARAGTKLKQVDAQLAIEKADQDRRPVISDHLDQPRVVRPRLLGNKIAVVSRSTSGDAARTPSAPAPLPYQEGEGSIRFGRRSGGVMATGGVGR